jgi:hypothetical protein
MVERICKINQTSFCRKTEDAQSACYVEAFVASHYHTGTQTGGAAIQFRTEGGASLSISSLARYQR